MRHTLALFACAWVPMNLKQLKPADVWEAGAGKRTVRVEGGMPGTAKFQAAEGPIAIRDRGSSAKKPMRGCVSRIGIVSELWRHPTKALLLVETYSGSCGEHRVIDAVTCAPVGKPASYCGGAKLVAGRLENEPPCEGGITKERATACSNGHVFTFDPKSCELREDVAASEALTRKVLGVVFPKDFRGQADVEWPASPRAKITKHD